MLDECWTRSIRCSSHSSGKYAARVTPMRSRVWTMRSGPVCTGEHDTRRVGGVDWDVSVSVNFTPFSPPAAIAITGLSKVFQREGGGETHVALNNLDLTVREGEFFCLLGPSGC